MIVIFDLFAWTPFWVKIRNRVAFSSLRLQLAEDVWPKCLRLSAVRITINSHYTEILSLFLRHSLNKRHLFVDCWQQIVLIRCFDKIVGIRRNFSICSSISDVSDPAYTLAQSTHAKIYANLILIFIVKDNKVFKATNPGGYSSIYFAWLFLWPEYIFSPLLCLLACCA